MINVTLQKSIRMLNYSYSETTRKRKYDVCGSLGDQFKPFAQGESSADNLFSEETLKAMKSELKNVKVKRTSTNTTQASKNSYSLPKTSRGEYSGGNWTKGKTTQKTSQNYNNYNNNNKNGSNKNNNNNNNSRWQKGKKN